MARDDEHNHGKTKMREGSSAWTRHDRSGEPKRHKLAADEGRHQQHATHNSVITIDEAPLPEVPPPSRSSPTVPDPLVCSKCTFNNRSSSDSGAPPLPVPSACAICLNPLQVNIEPVSSEGAAHPSPPAPRPGAEGQDSLRWTSGVVSAADFLPAEEPEQAMGDTRAKCPTCTVLLLGDGAADCHLCGAPLAPSRPLEVGWECDACTFRNGPGAVVCAACDTPLVDGGGGMGGVVNSGLLPLAVRVFGAQGDADRAKAGIVIPTSAELTARTIEEAGDTQATTPGILPRLQDRLLREYQMRAGGGRGGHDGPGRGSGSGRGGLDWYVSGGIGRKEVAEWRLCDPRTRHCTQRGSEGAGFSCGYRNIQMLCSALMEWPEYRRVLFGGSGCVPGIALLQCWIERAWANGYDPEGCEQLGGPGALMGSDKWIGATECATLLRSFGVKAEVIDFESTAPVEPRSQDGKSAQENKLGPNSKREVHDSPRASFAGRDVAHPLGPIQQSIRSYLPLSRPILEDCTPNGRDAGGGGVRSISGGSDFVSPGAQVRGNRDDARPERPQTVAGLSASSGFVGSRGGGGSRARRGRGRWARGGRYDGGRTGPGGRGVGNIGKDAGDRMGRAIVEWAWKYFSSPWGSEEWAGGDSFPSQPREGSGVAERSSDVQARSRRRGVTTSASVSAVAAAQWRCNSGGYDGIDAIGKHRVNVDGAPSEVGGAAAAAKRSAGGGADSQATRTRPPPPLYFQHDGHSRSVVGVLWPRGAKGNGGSASWGSGRGGGAGRGAGGRARQPGNLLVFDPSHAGVDIHRAFDGKHRLPWGSFLKRGEYSLRKRQFQMVAVRPGLVEAGQAMAWKNLVSSKIRVE